MAKAKRLPSGKWRCQAFDYREPDGTTHRRSFTADTKKEAEYLAAEFAATKEDHREEILDITFDQAVMAYIDSKESVLSPSTIRSYLGTYKKYIAGSKLGKLKISKINNVALQLWVGKLAKTGMSPKSVRNHYGLVSSTLGMFLPDFRPRITLPQPEQKHRYTPSDDDIKILINAIDDPELLIAVLLYSFGPMRRGEICALEHKHIHGNVIHVTNNMVKDKNNHWIIKAPKTPQSVREIEFPDFVIARIPKGSGRIISVTPDAITQRFRDLADSLDLPHFTMHDLRHYSASIMHAINVPDKYIMARGGWKTDRVLKTVYQNVIDLEAAKQQKRILGHFEQIANESAHESAHEKQKTL